MRAKRIGHAPSKDAREKVDPRRDRPGKEAVTARAEALCDAGIYEGLRF